jgi:hypothetical protein
MVKARIKLCERNELNASSNYFCMQDDALRLRANY